MKPRAAVILIKGTEIALIERYRSGMHYYVFPGGKIKSHETASSAAARETWEELGLQVHIEQMIAEVWYPRASGLVNVAILVTWRAKRPCNFLPA